MIQTFWGFPARSAIHARASSHDLLSASRPAFPRRLMSWSGFATSFEVKTQDGSCVSGVIAPVSASQEICATFTCGYAKGVAILAEGATAGARSSQYASSSLASYSRMAVSCN